MITKEDFYNVRVRPKAYWFWKVREPGRRLRNWVAAETAMHQAGKRGVLTDEDLRPVAERIARELTPTDASTDWIDAERFEAQILLAGADHDQILATGREIPIIGEHVESLVRFDNRTN